MNKQSLRGFVSQVSSSTFGERRATQRGAVADGNKTTAGRTGKESKTMSTVAQSESRYQLRYKLTPKAIIERVKATGDSGIDVGVTIKHGDPHFERAVDLIGLDKMSGKSSYQWIVVDGEFDSMDITADVLLDKLEEAVREQEEEWDEARAEYEAEVQRLLTCDPKALLCNRNGVRSAIDNPPSHDKPWVQAPALAFLFPKAGAKNQSRNEPLSNKRCADVVAEMARLIQEQDIILSAIEAGVKSAAANDRSGWIELNGSDRLKKCSAEGIQCDAIYRDERLASERPGWCWYDQCVGASDAPRNPDSEAFEMLEDARKFDAESEMYFHTVSAYDEFDDDGFTGERNNGWRGYTAEAMFQGKRITFGLPEEFWEK